MDHPASTTKARLGLRGIAVLALVGLFSLLLAPLASADVVVNNVVATGNGTITAGNSTSINYTLINQNSQNSVDTVNSCNTAGTGRVFYTIGVPANVTANGVAGGAGVALQIEFSDCDVPIPVIFSSTTAGSYAINGTASGTGTLSDTADFTLVVNPPADSTKPTISITTPANGATYAPGQAVAASYSCADEAGGSGLKSCVGTVANGANIDTATLGQNSFTVTAKDNANNSDTKTVTYTVADTADPDTAIT